MPTEPEIPPITMSKEQQEQMAWENLTVELMREADALVHQLEDTAVFDTVEAMLTATRDVSTRTATLEIVCTATVDDEEHEKVVREAWKKTIGVELETQVIAGEKANKYVVVLEDRPIRFELVCFKKETEMPHSYTTTYIRIDNVQGKGEHEMPMGALQHAIEAAFVDFLKKLWPWLEQAYPDPDELVDCTHDTLGAALEIVMQEQERDC